MEETIEGYVDHIIFRNQDNGYTVMVVVTEDEELTCVGSFQYMNEGETIKAFGHYTEHPSYGRQFVMSSYEVIVPQDSQAMERYLASGAVKGIERHWQQELSADLKKTPCVLWRKNRNALPR